MLMVDGLPYGGVNVVAKAKSVADGDAAAIRLQDESPVWYKQILTELKRVMRHLETLSDEQIEAEEV